MAKINSKLYGDQYQTLDDFMSDFQLMFDNACRYNEPDSQVYKVGNPFPYVVNSILLKVVTCGLIRCCSHRTGFKMSVRTGHLTGPKLLPYQINANKSAVSTSWCCKEYTTQSWTGSIWVSCEHGQNCVAGSKMNWSKCSDRTGPIWDWNSSKLGHAFLQMDQIGSMDSRSCVNKRPIQFNF